MKGKSRWAALLVALLACACAGSPTGVGDPTAAPSATSKATPSPTPAPTPDPLAGMTPEQKVGQLVMVGFPGPTLTPDLQQAFAKYRFGAVVLDDGDQNGQNGTQVHHLVEVMRSAEGPGPGPIVTTNQEGGTVCFSGAGLRCPPGQREDGASGDTQRIASDTTSMAQDLRALDFNSGLAPVADVWDGRSPFMADRSYGTDPATVARLVTAAVQADHAQGVLAVAKHFPGHGSAGDSHQFLPTVSHDSTALHQVDLPPFQAAITAGADMVMVGHLLVPAIDSQLPTSLSPHAMSLLRQELGYQGVIITDDLMMGAIQQHYSSAEAAVMALQAGADMVMFAGSIQIAVDAIQKILQAISTGRLSQAQIDSSVRRVLALKGRYKLISEALSG